MYEFKEVNYIPTKQKIEEIIGIYGKQGWQIKAVLPLTYSSSAVGVHIVILQREVKQ